MVDELAHALVDLKRDQVLETVKRRAEIGQDPLDLLKECRRGMEMVGQKFESGDFHLAELILSSEIFKGAMKILNPFIKKAQPPRALGNIVIATLKGDIHDLGKNIFASLLQAHGFEVYDLGVDIEPSLLVKKVEEINPHFVGFSALITSAFPSMKEASDLLIGSGLRETLKLMVGGGVTDSMVRDYVGADFQTGDAMEGVSYCISEMKGG